MKRILAALLLLAGPALAQAPPPVPALPDTSRITPYTLAGSTCACSVGFGIYADNASTDIDNWVQVWISSAAGQTATRYLSTDPVYGWTITSPTGSLALIPRPVTDALLTFNSAQTGYVVILGAQRPRRLNEFSENRGVPARDHNQVLNSLFAAEREAWDKLNSAIIGQPGEALNRLPAAASRANQVLSFDTGGNPIVLPTVPTTSPAPILQHVANNTALKALSAGIVPVIVRDGYTTAGDGGGATYVWGSSACTVSAGAGDNGWQVQPNAGAGCWTAAFPATGADVRVWGAVAGANVDTALKAAIVFGCSTTIPIYLPYPPAGSFYFLNSEIDIGNGSATTFSTCNGVSFFMTATNIESASAVNYNMAFRWNGAGGIIPFVVKGPGNGFALRGVGVDCNSICSTGFKLINTLDGDFEFLGVWYQTNGPAFYLTSIPNNNQSAGSEFNKIRSWKAINPGINGSGLQIGETTTSGANLTVITNTLIDIAVNWDGTCATCYGIQLGNANQNTIINPVAFPVGGSSGNSLKIVPVTGATTFPTDNLFIHPQFGAAANDPGASWTGTVGQTFIDYSTVSAVFPVSTVAALYSGTDIKGFSYPRGTWTPTDGSGASLSLTVTDATYVINNKMCTVAFNITYPSTASSASTQINGLPCTPTSGTNGAFGNAPSYTNEGTPLTIFVSNGAANFQLYNYSGANITNANMSTKQVRGTLTFPAQ